MLLVVEVVICFAPLTLLRAVGAFVVPLAFAPALSAPRGARAARYTTCPRAP